MQTWSSLTKPLISGILEILLVHISLCLPVAASIRLVLLLIWLRSWTSSLQRWQCASVEPLLESIHPKVCELFHARMSDAWRRQ